MKISKNPFAFFMQIYIAVRLGELQSMAEWLISLVY
jgi:hypothetical protein